VYERLRRIALKYLRHIAIQATGRTCRKPDFSRRLLSNARLDIYKLLALHPYDQCEPKIRLQGIHYGHEAILISQSQLETPTVTVRDCHPLLHAVNTKPLALHAHPQNAVINPNDMPLEGHLFFSKLSV
jgi:hypothetical protein